MAPDLHLLSASASSQAAGLAVLNAGIDMNFVPLATSLAVAEDGTLLLDPTSAEEKAAKATSVRYGNTWDMGHWSCKGACQCGCDSSARRLCR